MTHLCFTDISMSDAIFSDCPLLPSFAQQKNVMEYWQEGSTPTAVPPTSASDIVGQHHKIEGITFGAALTSTESLLVIFHIPR